ncbi:MAG: FeoC like transcriptional regulator [Gammaproteobacteria bacterium]|jgi:hypothetical protein|nr:FeoC like transcriptional regulator [Gammaproteobacteria bacterium]
MSLLQHIRDTLSAKKRLSLTALASACSCTTEDVEAQLCFYLHKGLVRKKNLRLPCGTTCQQCDLSALVIYEWV